MEIELLLRDHCIESAAKRMYARLLSRCLQPTGSVDMDDDPESRVEGLKHFLERVDFGYLRSRFPELNGSPPTRVVLQFSENLNDPVLVCAARHIVPRTKQQKGTTCITA